MFGHQMDEAPNGSKAVTLLLRLSTLALALTSGVFMATATDCAIYGGDGSRLTFSFRHFPPFVYMVWCNIVAAVLEATAIYLQVAKGEGEGEGEGEEAPRLPAAVLVVTDMALQALLYSATGAVVAAAAAYGPQISACAANGGSFTLQVRRSKFLSVAASVTAGLAAVAKDVALPFSVWPKSSSDDY